MSSRRSFLAGAAVAVGARAVLPRLLAVKFRRDLARLNAGDYAPLLSSYAEDAVLRFNEGPHRWSGDHRGRGEIERFFQDFVAAGLRGELVDVWTGGPPWALTILARFDDRAEGPDGEQLYANRVAMVIRTRWGRIFEHEDFYQDTGRILALEERLTRLGVEPSARPPAAA